jgi:ABC-type cobalamin/Fe3+-siderophores transport system ATPase subunit
MNAKTVKIHNVGPIHDLEIEMPSPGVYALVGDHGAGKSTALAAVARALGDEEVHVTLRDGATKGTVILDDVTLLAVGKIDRRTGKPSISLASTSPLATLVEPGIKDPVAAERARIQALLKLIEPVTDDKAISTLVQADARALTYLEEHEGIESLKEHDIVGATDKVRRLMHEMKREHEAEAQRAQGEMTANQPDKPEVLTETGVAAAEMQHDKTLRTLERLEGEFSQREAREQERDEIRATLGKRPDEDEYKQKAAATDIEIDSIAKDIQRLEQQLLLRKADLSRAKTDYQSFVRYAEQRKREVQQWDRRKTILDSDLTGATASDVAEANKAVGKAKNELERARESQIYRDRLERYNDAAERFAQATQGAADAERIALNVTGQLGKLLAATGVQNVTVEDGALVYIHEDGAREAFSRLSFGEKLKFSLGPFTAKNSDRILSLPFQFWMSLNAESQVEAAKLIAEHGIRAITEVPGSGELRVQKVEAK